MIRLLSTGPAWRQTAIRVILGMVFFTHGARKLKGWIAGVGLTESLRTLPEFAGVPAPLVFAATMSELTMLSAIAMLHWRFGLFMNWFGDNKVPGFECHHLAIGLAIVVIVRGSGALSLDRLLFLFSQ